MLDCFWILHPAYIEQHVYLLGQRCFTTIEMVYGSDSADYCVCSRLGRCGLFILVNECLSWHMIEGLDHICKAFVSRKLQMISTLLLHLEGRSSGLCFILRWYLRLKPLIFCLGRFCVGALLFGCLSKVLRSIPKKQGLPAAPARPNFVWGECNLKDREDLVRSKSLIWLVRC